MGLFGGKKAGSPGGPSSSPGKGGAGAGHPATSSASSAGPSTPGRGGAASSSQPGGLSTPQASPASWHDGHGPHYEPIVVPKDLKVFVASARERLAHDEGVIPCELTGKLHDNSSGHLRGFSSPQVKRAWDEQHLQQLRQIGPDILRRWHEIDPDFFLSHASTAGVPMPPYRQLQQRVHESMVAQAKHYEQRLSQLPADDLAEVKEFDELWPPHLLQELKDRCLQPDEAFTMRLNYAAGIQRLELLYIFSAGLARASGITPWESSILWSVKLPTRMFHKCRTHYPEALVCNDFRHIVDTYRTSVLADNGAQLKAMLGILECLGRQTFDRSAPLRKLGLAHSNDSFVVERIKNRFARPAPGGYSDILVNVRINGYICEVQLHHRAVEEISREEGRNLAKWFKHFVVDRGGYQQSQSEGDDHAGGGPNHQVGGGRYSGDLVEGHRHGRGTFYYHSGDRYEGQWLGGAKHGTGTYWYSAGDKYVGEWHEDRMHGNGKFISHKGSVFEGEYVNGMRHGNGTLKSPNGEVSQGTWWKNRRVDIVNM